jgi:chromosome condensin MukBEF MukE localization factor
MFPPINSNYDDLVDGFAFFKVIKEDSLFKSSLFLISDTSFNFTFSRGFLGNLNAVFPKKMNGEYCLIIPVQFFYLRSKSLSLKQQTIFQKQIVELSRRNLRIGKTVFCYSPEAIRRGCPH